MSSIAVAQGAAVQKGDPARVCGNTGNVYGAGGGYHLHLELRVDGSRVDRWGLCRPIKGVGAGMPASGVRRRALTGGLAGMPAPTAVKQERVYLTFGDFLYFIGFHVEYALVRIGRVAGWHTVRRGRCLRCWLWCCGPQCGRRAALKQRSPIRGSWRVRRAAAGRRVLAWFVHALARPFVLRVEVGGQVVGYVTDEQAFDAARADVQARLTGVADWNVQPAYTLVMADADTRPMTERETADAILRAAGGEITGGHRRLSDGALRFVTDEGDHLRQFLYAVRAPWQTDGVQTDFVHALRLVDGIYPAAAITPYPT